MVDEGRYTTSDKLAIALACLAGIMAIVLFLVEKTPGIVVTLLTLLVALSVYPVIHFVRSILIRTCLLLCVIGVVLILGWREWPIADAASRQQPAIQQTNQGNNNTNINGNGNTVSNTIVIKRDDPAAREILQKLDKLVKNQERLTPEKILLKYPLGYVIFYATFRDSVFPYQTREELQGLSIDWTTFKFEQGIDWNTFRNMNVQGSTSKQSTFWIQLPSITYGRSLPQKVFGNVIGLRKRVGERQPLIEFGDVMMSGEILAINPNGVVFLFGFSHE